MAKTYKAVKISRGNTGWGGPLVIEPTAQRNKVVSVTGGGIHPIAAQIAEMTGAEAVDGFRAPPIESEMAVVVVDCGGTARCGVYPRKRIPTVNLTPVGQSGPLAQFITEDIYVSGVKPANITMADGSEAVTTAGGAASMSSSNNTTAAAPQPLPSEGGLIGFISSIGRVMGRVVGIFFNAGRRTIDQVIRNVLPFMAFVTMLIGLILYTGIGDILAQPMGPLANNIVGLLIISAIVPVAHSRAGRCHRAGHRRRHHRPADRQRHDLSGNGAAGAVCLQHPGRVRLRAGRSCARRSQAEDHRDRCSGGAHQPPDHGPRVRADRMGRQPVRFLG